MNFTSLSLSLPSPSLFLCACTVAAMALQKPLWLQRPPRPMVMAPSAISPSLLPQKSNTGRVCRLLLRHSGKAAAARLTRPSADSAPLWKKIPLKVDSFPVLRNRDVKCTVTYRDGFESSIHAIDQHLEKDGFVVHSSDVDAAEYGDAVREACNNRRKKNGDSEDEEDSDDDDDYDDHRPFMDQKERWEMRRKIRQIIDANPGVEEERDPEEKKKLMEQLLSEYPLVVDEEDPNWPEDSDGWGFNFSQFFDKITIKNVRKDDEDYDSEKEMEWQDDNYIRAVKDIGSKEWEETVFKDISPLIIFVHNRYKRPKENERARNDLEKAVQIFWDSGLPSPRCIALDAVVEDDLVSALKISTFPELLFTKSGKIFYRQTVISNADELSKIMAFFYYGAARPACLSETDGEGKELIPALPGRS